MAACRKQDTTAGKGVHPGTGTDSKDCDPKGTFPRGSFPKNTHKIFFLTARLHGEGHRYITAELEKAGLTGIVPSHGDILNQLFSCADCKMSDLAKRIHRTKSTVTVLVAKLEKHGYVERFQDADDMRGVRVRLTDKGRTLLPVVEEISCGLENLLTSRMEAEELDELERLLEKCVQQGRKTGQDS